MPLFLVRELAGRMAEVEAGERTRDVEMAALARMMRYTVEDARRMLRALDERASGGRRERAPRLPKGMLAGIGIGYTEGGKA